MRFYSVDELLGFPPPEWLFEPFITAGGVTILFGKTGSYKSFQAVDWAARTPGLTAYISAEGSPHQFGERVRAWERSAGRSAEIVTHPSSIDLTNEREMLIDALRGFDGLRLLVIDTASRNMGGDENSSMEMAGFVASIDKVRAEFACAVLVIHHTGHENDDRGRGSSVLPAAADIIVRAQRVVEKETKLTCVKMRDAVEFEPLTVRLVDVGGQLVAAEPVTRRDALEVEVAEYLEQHPTASQREVEKAIEGRAVDIRRAYKGASRASETRDARASGASQSVRPLSRTSTRSR